MIELLENIGQAGIAFTLLIVAILYFLKKEKEWNEKEKELEDKLSISREENIKLMYKLTTVMDKLFDVNNLNKNEILNELHNLKTYLEDKINSQR